MQFGSGWNVNVDLINFRFLVVFVLNVFFFFYSCVRKVTGMKKMRTYLGWRRLSMQLSQAQVEYAKHQLNVSVSDAVWFPTVKSVPVVIFTKFGGGHTHQQNVLNLLNW